MYDFAHLMSFDNSSLNSSLNVYNEYEYSPYSELELLVQKDMAEKGYCNPPLICTEEIKAYWEQRLS